MLRSCSMFSDGAGRRGQLWGLWLVRVPHSIITPYYGKHNLPSPLLLRAQQDRYEKAGEDAQLGLYVRPSVLRTYT